MMWYVEAAKTFLYWLNLTVLVSYIKPDIKINTREMARLSMAV